MVSALWNACSDGDLDMVKELLNDSSQADVEVKDHAGVTPLIEAVKNGHVEVVRILIERGADPTNQASQGPPEQYTSDPAILEMLSAARNKIMSQRVSPDNGYPQEMNGDVAKGYYPPPPPPGPYYYPGMPLPPPPMMPDGGVAFYSPPPPHFLDHSGSGGFSNLPPPEIARMIPCRYYPACRYGTSCMFAHPQAPYIQGPLPPPAQYPPPFDPTSPSHQYPPYYPAPPPSFQQPTNGVPLSAVSPTLSPTVPPQSASHPAPPMIHGRSPSDVSPAPAPFNGAPPPSPYGIPHQYGHPVPMPIPSHSPISGPQSPQHAMYPPTSPSAVVPGPSQYSIQPVGYAHQSVIPNGNHHDSATSPKSPTFQPQPDMYLPAHREPYGHHRRGSTRRPSFGLSRKPPCLFFPAGKCKNGDDCRFPHVLSDGAPMHPPPHFPPRGVHRPRPSIHTNGVNGLEDRFAALTTQDQVTSTHAQPPAVNGNHVGSVSNVSSRSQSTEPHTRPRGPPGLKSNGFTNGHRPDRRQMAPKPQRVPSADDFPVLNGSSTPPLRSPGASSASGWSGPTAAQVLKAPAPTREESLPGTRGASPANGRPGQPQKEVKPEPSGVHTQPNGKLPISFASVAAPEATKDVSVSA
ncbi:hypothetical protein BC835DRAFT_1408020 [Cytidiella melzeri]|nr:hypothetical protein BC835DRAFT_1408020 [Cytidiella melzeri]